MGVFHRIVKRNMEADDQIQRLALVGKSRRKLREFLAKHPNATVTWFKDLGKDKTYRAIAWVLTKEEKAKRASGYGSHIKIGGKHV